MNIHFASMIGVDFDLDIFPWWSRFYLDLGFDSYKLFAHRENGPVTDDEVNHLRSFGFDVEKSTGLYANGILRQHILAPYAASLPREDYLVTADADEFQFMPRPDISRPDISRPEVRDTIQKDMIIPYRDIFEEYDFISGWMVDRWTDTLCVCDRDPFVLYDQEEDITKDILKAVIPPYLEYANQRKQVWPVTRRTKVLGSRVDYNVAYEGSHCLYENPGNSRNFENCNVIHFAWREGSRKKMITKNYYSNANLDAAHGGKAPEDEIARRGTSFPQLVTL